MDCAVKGVGDVKQYTHCCQAFFSECRYLEHYFKLLGDICLECHDELHDIVECHWQPLPPKLMQLVADFAATEISMDMVIWFWCLCTQFFQSDKKFNMSLYNNALPSKLSSYILAANMLLEGKDNKAVCMLICCFRSRDLEAWAEVYHTNFQHNTSAKL